MDCRSRQKWQVSSCPRLCHPNQQREKSKPEFRRLVSPGEIRIYDASLLRTSLATHAGPEKKFDTFHSMYLCVHWEEKKTNAEFLSEVNRGNSFTILCERRVKWLRYRQTWLKQCFFLQHQSLSDVCVGLVQHPIKRCCFWFHCSQLFCRTLSNSWSISEQVV